MEKNEKPSKENVSDVYKEFSSLPTSEKRHVSNYNILSSWLDTYQIPVSSDDFSAENIGESPSKNQDGHIVNVTTQTPIIPQMTVEEDLKKVNLLNNNDITLSDGILIASTLYQAAHSDTKLDQEQLNHLNEKN